MLQAIIHGQGTLKQELLSKIDKVDQKVDMLGEKLEGKIDRVEKKLNTETKQDRQTACIS